MKFDYNQPYSYLRILHALPEIPGYDYYVDEQRLGKDLIFEDFTDYIPLSATEHLLQLFPHKGTKEPILSYSFRVAPGRIYTLICTLEPNTGVPQAYLINDPPKKIPEEHFLLRTIAFTTLPEGCQLHLGDTLPIFKKIKLYQATPYLAFSPGAYPLELMDQPTATSLFDMPPQVLKQNRYYTLYLLGGSTLFPLQGLLTIDGNSYLSFPAAHV